MLNQVVSREASVSRRQGALLMALCGLVGAATGAAGAVTPTAEAPQISIQVSPENLATDQGAQEVYRQLVKAAEKVCPGTTTGTRLPNAAAMQCREQAVAAAVHQINNSRLAAVYAAQSKRS